MSGVPVGHDDGILSKGKAEGSQGVSTLVKNAVSGDVVMAGSQKMGKIKDEEESSELTEPSDDGGMLEVHD
jgi:hypothetical protein